MDYDEDDEHPDFDDWQEQRANRTAKLIMMVQVFTKNVTNIEQGIEHLYDLIEDEDEVAAAVGSLIELGEALQVAIDSCDAAVLGLIGWDEPKPETEVEDFEQSVLNDLANLDKITKDALYEARKQHYRSELNRRGFGFI